MTNLILQGYIPLDKSWIIRMGLLDLLNGYEDIDKFLAEQKELSDDLEALKRAIIDWKNNGSVYVGESGTLYRFLKFAAWKLKLKKEFIFIGTLQERKILDDPKIIDYSLVDLLKLDEGTSQWASAAVLLGNKEKVFNSPYKLKLTYEAVAHWREKRERGECWEARYDQTILRQAEAFLELFKQGKTNFIPEQAEDYCFARAFEFITGEEGKLKWPSLVGHESNRIEEMERMLKLAEENQEINSSDHRVVQVIAMRQRLKNKPIKIKYPEAVNKSWPQFWRFIKSV